MNDASPPIRRAGCGPRVRLGHASSLRHSVYDCVRACGSLSRAEIAKALDVSPGTVTALAGELIGAGYLVEAAEARQTGRGRPPVALSIRPEAGLVAGLRIGDRTASAVLVDMGGQIRAALRRDLPEGRGAAETEDAADAMLRALLTEAVLPLEALSAVGVGLPGLIDHHTGEVVWSPVITETALPLAARLSERWSLPVQIDNDANTATLAELWFGAGRDLDDFVVVTIEGGVGMGLVIGNRLFRGGQGLGMELGHTKVALDGALCRCGRRGCLEAYVADYALLREAATALGAAPSAQLLERLHDAAKAGHPAAEGIFRRAGRYMAMGLSNVAQLFDPGRIILSGERLAYDMLYAEAVTAEMATLATPAGRPSVPVEIHAWGGSVWARGAAAMALEAATDAALGSGWPG